MNIKVIELTQVFAIIIRWLMISVLFAAPLAIAKHQLEHYESAQAVIEQCNFCAKSQSLDSFSISAIQVRTSGIINLGTQTNKLSKNLQHDQVNHFLSRAPPR